MSKRRITLEEEALPEINMSPMVDMIFLLLIFFMVTTVFTKDTAVGIKRPSAKSATELQTNDIVLCISANGVITHKGQVYQMRQIPALLKEQLEGKGRATIIADKDNPTGITVQLIDQCRLAGIEDISLAASNEAP